MLPLLAAGALLFGADVVLTGHGARANTVAFSPDGKHVASGASDGTLIVWDVSKGALLKKETLGGGAKVVDVAWRGKTVVAGTTAGTLVEWNPFGGSGPKSTVLNKNAWVSAVAAHDFGEENDEITLAGSYDGRIHVWDRSPQDANIKSFDAGIGPIGALALHPEDRGVAFAVPSSSGREDGVFRIDSGAGSNERVASKAGGAISAVSGSFAFAEGNNVRIVAGSAEASVDARSPVTSVAQSATGVRIAAGCEDGVARVWTLVDGVPSKEAQHLEGHGDAVTDVAFSPDQKRLASASRDGTIRLWDLSLKRRSRVKTGARPLVLPRVRPLGGGCVAAAVAHLGSKVPVEKEATKTFAGPELVKALLASPECTEMDDSRVYKSIVPAPSKKTASWAPYDLREATVEYSSELEPCAGDVVVAWRLRVGDDAGLPVVAHTRHAAKIPWHPIADAPSELPAPGALTKGKRKVVTTPLGAAPGFDRLEMKQTYALLKPLSASETPATYLESLELSGWLAGSPTPVTLHRAEARLSIHGGADSPRITGVVVTDLDDDSQPDVLLRSGDGGEAVVRIGGGRATFEWLKEPAPSGDGC